MKNKTKIIFSSALAAIGTIVPLSTIVSCGQLGQPEVDPVRVERLKVETKSGELSAKFSFLTAEIKKDNQSLVCENIEYERESTEGWEIDAGEKGIIPLTNNAKRATLGVTLKSTNGAYPNPGTTVVFKANISCYEGNNTKPLWTKKFNSLTIKYVCEEGDITPVETTVFTAPGASQTGKAVASISFLTNSTEIPAGANVEVANYEITGMHDADGLTNDAPILHPETSTISIPFEMQGSNFVDDTDDNGSHVYFTNLRLVCVSSTNKVLWDKTFTDEFKIKFSERNVGASAEEATPEPEQEEAGSLYHDLKVYRWEGLNKNNTSFVAEPVETSNSDFTLSAVIRDLGQDEHGYYFLVRVTITATGKPVDQMIKYKLTAKYAAPLKLPDEVVCDTTGNDQFGVWYISKKIDCTSKPKQETGYDETSFPYKMQYLGELPSDVTLSYEIETIEGTGTAVVGPDTETPITEMKEGAFDALVNIVAEKNNDFADFNIIVYGNKQVGKETEHVWKQTIKGCQLIAKKAASIDSTEILTTADNPSGVITFTLSDPAFAQDTFEIDKIALDSSSTANIKFGAPTATTTTLSYPVTLVEKDALPTYDAFAKFTFDLSDRTAGWTKTFNDVSVYFNGTIELNETSSKLQTEIGLPKRDIHFNLLGCKRYLDLTKYDLTYNVKVAASSPDSVEVVDTPTLDIHTGAYTLPVSLKHKDATDIFWSTNDAAEFSVEFTLKDKETNKVLWTRTIGSIVLVYASIFNDPQGQKYDLPEGNVTATTTLVPAESYKFDESVTITPVVHSGQKCDVKIGSARVEKGSMIFESTITKSSALADKDQVEFDIKVTNGKVNEIIKNYCLIYNVKHASVDTTNIAVPVGEKDPTRSEQSNFVVQLAEKVAADQDIKVTLGKCDEGVQLGKVTQPKPGSNEIEVPVYIQSADPIKINAVYNLEIIVSSSNPTWTSTISNLSVNTVAGFTPETTEVKTDDKDGEFVYSFTTSKEPSKFTPVAEISAIEGPGLTITKNFVKDGDKYILGVRYTNPSQVTSGDVTAFNLKINLTVDDKIIYTINLDDQFKLYYQESSQYITCTTPKITIDKDHPGQDIYVPTGAFQFSLKTPLAAGQSLTAEITSQSQVGGVLIPTRPAKVASKGIVVNEDKQTASMDVYFSNDAPIYRNTTVEFTVEVKCTDSQGSVVWTEAVPAIQLIYDYQVFTGSSGETSDITEESHLSTLIKFYSVDQLTADGWKGNLVDAETGEAFVEKAGCSVTPGEDAKGYYLEVSVNWNQSFVSSWKTGDSVKFYFIGRPNSDGPSYICDILCTVTKIF